MTSLNSSRLANRSARSLSIASQRSHAPKDGMGDGTRGEPSSSISLRKVGDVIVERVPRSISSVPSRNWVNAMRRVNRRRPANEVKSGYGDRGCPYMLAPNVMSSTLFVHTFNRCWAVYPSKCESPIDRKLAPSRSALAKLSSSWGAPATPIRPRWPRKGGGCPMTTGTIGGGPSLPGHWTHKFSRFGNWKANCKRARESPKGNVSVSEVRVG